MNTIIEIALDPVLHDFLYHEFKTDNKSDSIIITRDKPIGKYIVSMFEPLDRSYKRENQTNLVRLMLPVTSRSHYKLQNSYLHIPSWKEEMINDYLKAEWHKRVTDIFAIGREKGFKTKHIIEAIIKEYGMKNNAISFDRIKKMDYRNRESFIKKVINEIQCAII